MKRSVYHHRGITPLVLPRADALRVPRYRFMVLLLACACILLLAVPVLAADCPSGCSCLSPEQALKDGYVLCSGKQVLCSYDSTQRPMYCYQKPASLAVATRTLVPIDVTTTATTAECPQGCECLTDELAKQKFGSFQHCSETPCAKAVTGSASIVAYCSKPAPTQYPACPSGCSCMNEVQAKEKYGSSERCSDQVCGPSTAATANLPQYCYRPVTTTTPQPACTAPCECMTDTQAKTKFGENGYSRCSATPCGTESMTTAAAVVQKYCIQQGGAVVSAATRCPSGCSCMTEAAAKEKGYSLCRGQRTSCGYDATQQPLFCFEVTPSSTCAFDYQQGACAGTCDKGYTCSIIAMEKDATGAVKYGVCGCQPPATECSYNANLQSCTGTCPNAGTCTITGKKVDASGAVSIACGCESGACFFDYAKDTCTGSCPAGTGVCQLNTIYRDAAGKTIYGECHCKEKPEEETPVTVTETKPTVTATKTQPPGTAPCTCTAGSCTGYCPDGQTCWMTATATDNLGKVSCTQCACRETCTLTANNECTGSCPDGSPCVREVYRDPATGAEKAGCACGGTAGAPAETTKAAAPAPASIIEAITSFFRSLFGMK